jgi:uncharacterized membrane protein
MCRSDLASPGASAAPAPAPEAADPQTFAPLSLRTEERARRSRELLTDDCGSGTGADRVASGISVSSTAGACTARLHTGLSRAGAAAGPRGDEPSPPAAANKPCNAFRAAMQTSVTFLPSASIRLRGIAALAAAALAVLTVGAAGALAGRQTTGKSASSPRSPIPVFVLDKGRFSAFDSPGVRAQQSVDINNRGEIAGGYSDAAGTLRGFLRARRGGFSSVEVPGAALTGVNGINDRGHTVGNYCDAASCAAGFRGFLRDRGGRFRTIRVPGSVSTRALSIDNRGRVVGDYLGADGISHGYLWDRNRFITFDVPGSMGTSVTDINERGEIVGAYIGADGAFHGFFRDRRSGLTTIDAGGVPYTSQPASTTAARSSASPRPRPCSPGARSTALCSARAPEVRSAELTSPARSEAWRPASTTADGSSASTRTQTVCPARSAPP